MAIETHLFEKSLIQQTIWQDLNRNHLSMEMSFVECGMRCNMRGDKCNVFKYKDDEKKCILGQVRLYKVILQRLGVAQAAVTKRPKIS